MKMEMTSARVHLGAQEHGTSASCHAKNTNMHDDRRLHTSFLSRPSVKDVSGVAGVMKARDQLRHSSSFCMPRSNVYRAPIHPSRAHRMYWAICAAHDFGCGASAIAKDASFASGDRGEWKLVGKRSTSNCGVA